MDFGIKFSRERRMRHHTQDPAILRVLTGRSTRKDGEGETAVGEKEAIHGRKRDSDCKSMAGDGLEGAPPYQKL